MFTRTTDTSGNGVSFNVDYVAMALDLPDQTTRVFLVGGSTFYVAGEQARTVQQALEQHNRRLNQQHNMAAQLAQRARTA